MNIMTDLNLNGNTITNPVIGTKQTLGVSDKVGLLVSNNNKLYYNDGTWQQLKYVRTPTTTSYTIAANSWNTTTHEYTISISGMVITDEVVLDIATTITEAAYDQLAAAKIVVLSQANGAVTIKALGSVPTVDIPISITVTPQ